MHEKIIILDFGGQYAHLIASRIRRENVLAEIVNPDEVELGFFSDPLVKGIILSGGPQSVFADDSPRCDVGLFDLGKPVLGICYGHQYLNHSLGGEVKSGKVHEFGRASIAHNKACPLFANIPEESVFWMSHGDEVVKLADGFESIGSTKNCANAAVWNQDKNLFGIQFHPEVTHSEFGSVLLKNFLDICDVKADWTMEKFLAEEKQKIVDKVGDKNVFLFVSGGVDSTVAFSLLSQTLGADRVKGLFVDTGMMRRNEVGAVKEAIEGIGAHLTILEEGDTFLGNLNEVYEPEKKREIIGNSFLQVQNAFFAKNDLHEGWILAQGTIYPDTIETGGTKNAAKIKTHHNRVPEIQKLIDAGKVIEPLAELYKDEVRELGELLGLPHELVWRHPFPGPGLGVRILCQEEDLDQPLTPKGDHQVLPIKSVGVQGDYRTYRHPAILGVGKVEADNFDLNSWAHTATDLINGDKEINRALVLLGSRFEAPLEKVKLSKTHLTQQRVQRLQVADDIVTRTLLEMELYEKVWQFPTVLVPMAFNGTGVESIILRPIDSIDAMSATVGALPFQFFERVTAEILKDTDISAVLLDVTSKPPGTIEWE